MPRPGRCIGPNIAHMKSNGTAWTDRGGGPVASDLSDPCRLAWNATAGKSYWTGAAGSDASACAAVTCELGHFDTNGDAGNAARQAAALRRRRHICSDASTPTAVKCDFDHFDKAGVASNASRHAARALPTAPATLAPTPPRQRASQATPTTSKRSATRAARRGRRPERRQQHRHSVLRRRHDSGSHRRRRPLRH